MSFLIAFFLELLLHDFWAWWSGSILLATILYFLVHEEEFSLLSGIRLCGGVIGLGLLDLVKYGRVGVSLITLSVVWSLFLMMRRHFYAGRPAELCVLAILCVLCEKCIILPFLLATPWSLAVTAWDFSGTLATVLVLLGMRGSRFSEPFTVFGKRKVWTPNRKSAL